MRSCTCFAHDGFQLSPEGLAQRDHLGPELAGVVAMRYLDKVGSVSALVEVEDDFDYAEDHIELNQRLIHRGS